MHLFKPVASRSLRRKFRRNALSRKRYYGNKITPFGYKTTSRDKQLATLGAYNKHNKGRYYL